MTPDRHLAPVAESWSPSGMPTPEALASFLRHLRVARDSARLG